MYGLAYHKDYNKYDLGISHPLLENKPKKTIEFFKDKGLLDKLEIFTPSKVSETDILRVHSKKYLNHLKWLNKNGGWLANDTPAPVGFYKYACIAAGGTVLAGEKLFEDFNIMINPLAGFHHASRGFSSGFCFLNDIAITTEFLREKYNLKRFEIIDLDVHHANGTQEIYYDDSTVLNISFHQDGRTLYPGTGFIDKIGKNNGEGFTVNLPLPSGTDGYRYLYSFDEIIPPITKQFKPEIIIYQSGVDTHHKDPLANLNLTYQTYYHIASRIKKLSEYKCNKLLVAFGGGYNIDSSIISSYNITCGLLGLEKHIEEKQIIDRKQKDIQITVNKLKNTLKPYWDL